MNAATRKTLEAIVFQIEDVDLNGFISTLEEQAEAEQEKFDNLNEGLQQSERGQTFEQAAEHLTNAVDALNSANDALLEAIDAINEAVAL